MSNRLYPSVCSDNTQPTLQQTVPQQQEKVQPQITYGYNAPPPTYTSAPKVRPPRSAGCQACCAICALFMIVIVLVSIVFMVLWLRCTNAVVGLNNVKFYGPYAENVTGIKSDFDWGKLDIMYNSSETNVSFIVTTKAATYSAVNKMSVSTTFEDGIFSLNVDGLDQSFFDCPQVELVIVIPAGVVVPNIDFSLTNGRIKIGSIPEVLGHISGSTTNGEITVEDLDATSVKLETTNGKIVVKKLNSAAIDLKTTNGQITGSNVILPMAPCKLSFETTNGQIEVDKLDIQADSSVSCDIDLTTTNGEIDIDDVYGYNGKFDVETSNGDISVRGDVTFTTKSDDHKAGRVHAGGPSTLDLESTNGEINVYFN